MQRNRNIKYQSSMQRQKYVTGCKAGQCGNGNAGTDSALLCELFNWIVIKSQRSIVIRSNFHLNWKQLRIGGKSWRRLTLTTVQGWKPETLSRFSNMQRIWFPRNLQPNFHSIVHLKLACTTSWTQLIVLDMSINLKQNLGGTLTDSDLNCQMESIISLLRYQETLISLCSSRSGSWKSGSDLMTKTSDSDRQSNKV